jgi:hypothetical protein
MTSGVEGDRLVLSATKEIEPGFRAMMFYADGLFRLDVTLFGDTVKTVIRNLSPGQLETRGPATEPTGVSIGLGDAGAYDPGRIEFEFSLGRGQDRIEVTGMIATLRFRERGTVRMTGQLIVGRAPVS